MFLNKSTWSSIPPNCDNITQLRTWIDEADCVLIGAGAGLSTSAGLHYGGERFRTLFPDYIARYDLTDMYSSAFYPFPSREAFWGYFSKHIFHNRYDRTTNNCYSDLFALVENKDYFVLTTNADHLFIDHGFDKNRLFYTQGDYGLFQCSTPCHTETYDNRAEIMQMIAQQKDLKIPSALLPKCPKCGGDMEVNLRKDSNFVQDEGWYRACKRYEGFLKHHKGQKILFLELGIGYNTPAIVKYPFWRMTHQLDRARYVCINVGDIEIPIEISAKSLGISQDIAEVLSLVLNR